MGLLAAGAPDNCNATSPKACSRSLSLRELLPFTFRTATAPQGNDPRAG